LAIYTHLYYNTYRKEIDNLWNYTNFSKYPMKMKKIM
jgi:hypothetical protein